MLAHIMQEVILSPSQIFPSPRYPSLQTQMCPSGWTSMQSAFLSQSFFAGLLQMPTICGTASSKLNQVSASSHNRCCFFFKKLSQLEDRSFERFGQFWGGIVLSKHMRAPLFKKSMKKEMHKWQWARWVDCVVSIRRLDKLIAKMRRNQGTLVQSSG